MNWRIKGEVCFRDFQFNKDIPRYEDSVRYEGKIMQNTFM